MTQYIIQFLRYYACLIFNELNNYICLQIELVFTRVQRLAKKLRVREGKGIRRSLFFFCRRSWMKFAIAMPRNYRIVPSECAFLNHSPLSPACKAQLIILFVSIPYQHFAKASEEREGYVKFNAYETFSSAFICVSTVLYDANLCYMQSLCA